ncbi:hypothetical protein C8Q70DRAFT_601957 [Cubamyces menziesii]|nr:hypothetical protein C8Q70DRAFT_601957 [Cubamyces menziesii]
MAVAELSGLRLITAKQLKQAWPRTDFAESSSASGFTSHCVDPPYTIDHRLYAVVQRYREEMAEHDPESDVEHQVTLNMVELITRLGGIGEDCRQRYDIMADMLRHPRVFNIVLLPPPSKCDVELGIDWSVLELENEYQACLASADLSSYERTRICRRILDVMHDQTPFPDDGLPLLGDLIRYCMHGHGFVDLSGFHLSCHQLVELLAPLELLRSLSLARNPHLRTCDIPALLEALPRVSRLNVMGCPLITTQELLELMSTDPCSFRTLEALMHPSLLTVDKPTPYPIAFTFVCASPGLSLLHGMCLSLFSPSQVLQAVKDILMDARRELESTLPYDRRGLHDHLPWHLRSDANIAFRTSYRMVHSFAARADAIALVAFSTGAGTPGENRGHRLITSVPGPRHALVSDGSAGSWVFLLDLGPSPDDKTWTFIRYDPSTSPQSEDVVGECSDTMTSEQQETWQKKGMLPPGRSYDLRGFLRCMADECRPLPSQELVEEIESLLDSHKASEEFPFCTMMREEDVPPAFTRLPQPSEMDFSRETDSAMHHILHQLREDGSVSRVDD